METTFNGGRPEARISQSANNGNRFVGGVAAARHSSFIILPSSFSS